MTTSTTYSDAELLGMIAQATELWRRGDWRPSVQQQRLRKLRQVLAEHPDARLECCAAERTGCRYGNAKCRKGRAELVGYTHWDGQGSGYQLWAVW